GQACTHSGGSPESTCPAAHSISSPSACLHGNFRLGQEHRNAGSASSTHVWYGFLPLPWQKPHTASSDAPAPDHLAGAASARPAFSDAGSGASPATRSAVHGTAVTTCPPTGSPRFPVFAEACQ